MYSMTVAHYDHMPAINEIYKACKWDLLKNNIFQWDDYYPSARYFEACIEEKTLFLLGDEAQVVGVVVLNEWQSDEWEAIQWKFTHPLVVHALILHPSFQGQGLGSELLGQCEQIARDRGYDSIRLDSFAGNVSSCQFYESKHYERRGSVTFDSKPSGHQTYICYEKSLVTDFTN